MAHGRVPRSERTRPLASGHCGGATAGGAAGRRGGGGGAARALFRRAPDLSRGPGLPEPLGPGDRRRHRREPGRQGRGPPPGRVRPPARDEPRVRPGRERSAPVGRGRRLLLLPPRRRGGRADDDPSARRRGVPLERRHRRAEAGRVGRPPPPPGRGNGRRQGRCARLARRARRARSGAARRGARRLRRAVGMHARPRGPVRCPRRLRPRHTEVRPCTRLVLACARRRRAGHGQPRHARAPRGDRRAGRARRRPSATARPSSAAHRAHVLRGSQPDPRPPADRDPHDRDDHLVAPHRTPGASEERARRVVVELRALQQHPASQPLPRPHPSRARQRGPQPADPGERAGASRDAAPGLRRAVRGRRSGGAHRRGHARAGAAPHRPHGLGRGGRVPAHRQSPAARTRRARDRAARAVAVVCDRPPADIRLGLAHGRDGHDGGGAHRIRADLTRRGPGARPHGAAAHDAGPSAPPHRSDRHVAAHRTARVGAAAHRFTRRVRRDPAAIQRAEQRAPRRPRGLRRHAVGRRQVGARERAGSVRPLCTGGLEGRSARAGPRARDRDGVHAVRRRARGRRRALHRRREHPCRRRPRVVPSAWRRGRWCARRVRAQRAVVSRCGPPWRRLVGVRGHRPRWPGHALTRADPALRDRVDRRGTARLGLPRRRRARSRDRPGMAVGMGSARRGRSPRSPLR